MTLACSSCHRLLIPGYDRGDPCFRCMEQIQLLKEMQEMVENVENELKKEPYQLLWLAMGVRLVATQIQNTHRISLEHEKSDRDGRKAWFEQDWVEVDTQSRKINTYIEKALLEKSKEVIENVKLLESLTPPASGSRQTKTIPSKVVLYYCHKHAYEQLGVETLTPLDRWLDAGANCGEANCGMAASVKTMPREMLNRLPNYIDGVLMTTKPEAASPKEKIAQIDVEVSTDATGRPEITLTNSRVLRSRRRINR